MVVRVRARALRVVVAEVVAVVAVVASGREEMGAGHWAGLDEAVAAQGRGRRGGSVAQATRLPRRDRDRLPSGREVRAPADPVSGGGNPNPPKINNGKPRSRKKTKTNLGHGRAPRVSKGARDEMVRGGGVVRERRRVWGGAHVREDEAGAARDEEGRAVAKGEGQAQRQVAAIVGRVEVEVEHAEFDARARQRRLHEIVTAGEQAVVRDDGHGHEALGSSWESRKEGTTKTKQQGGAARAKVASPAQPQCTVRCPRASNKRVAASEGQLGTGRQTALGERVSPKLWPCPTVGRIAFFAQWCIFSYTPKFAEAIKRARTTMKNGTSCAVILKCPGIFLEKRTRFARPSAKSKVTATASDEVCS